MIVSSTSICGARVIDLEPAVDQRGFFARTWCRRELAEQGLSVEIAQESISFNREKRHLRGVHFQKAPHEEVKIVRCIRGAILDVISEPQAAISVLSEVAKFRVVCRQSPRSLCTKGVRTRFPNLDGRD